MQPRYADARNLLVRLLARCNDVGLFAKFDPLTGRMLGTFPQAYSVGLINSALSLSRDVGPVAERAQSPQCANSHFSFALSARLTPPLDLPDRRRPGS